MTLYEKIKEKRKKIIRESGMSVNSIPEVQKSICKKLPDLFASEAFFKMRPRPCKHPFAREHSYYEFCIKHVNIKGMWLEFGVYKGASCKIINKIKNKLHPNSQQLNGFDSFEGLPEAWTGNGSPKGKFKTEMPSIPGVKLHKGWFKDTIPEFAKHHKDQCAFIHIDCDIYSSTVDILEGLSDRIVPGTIILFDELIGQNAWKDHEYKAFMEFVKKYNIEYEWIAFVANAGQAACKITKKGENNEII